jgi:mono/diheme cytochrome c family protein
VKLHTVVLTVLILTFGGVSEGLRAAPVASKTDGGRYLTQAGDCISCHTAPGGKPFAGGLYMPTPFGEISVPNITPDVETGIGGWSDDEFYRAMHDGIGKHGEYLYPVFPFPWFTHVTRADVLAIRAYLRTLPAVHAQRPPLKLSFPASERQTLLAWRTLFFHPGEFKPDPNKAAAVNRGAYLVEGLGHCGECHNRHNEAGVSRWSGSLEGAEIDGWYAPNLTSDAREGIGSWPIQDLMQFLRTGFDPHAGPALGPMKDVIQQSLRHLTPSDLEAIATYLKSVPAQETFKAVPTSEFASAHAPGSAEYATFCASCHGLKGEGFSDQIPPLRGVGVVTAEGPQNVLRVILGGLPATASLGPMPAVGVSMSDQQVADAANFVRNEFGNHAAGDAAPGMVAELRSRTRTVIAGDPQAGCPQPPPALHTTLAARHVNAKLTAMTEVTMLSVAHELAVGLQAAAPRSNIDDLVNALTDSYCGVLRSRDLSPARRSSLLGNFAMLTYGQLKSNGHGL